MKLLFFHLKFVNIFYVRYKTFLSDVCLHLKITVGNKVIPEVLKVPLGDLLQTGILREHNGIQSCPILCHGGWTFKGHGCFAHVFLSMNHRIQS